MELPLSTSLLHYFQQVREERKYHHERKERVQVQEARKKGKSKKYSHKKESTAKDRIQAYKVIDSVKK